MADMLDKVGASIQARIAERGGRKLPPAIVRHVAGAAIEAMRDPTLGMLDEADSDYRIKCGLDDCNMHDIPVRSWGLMIDAALAGK